MRVFDNFDELAPIQKEWDDFTESMGSEIFLTYDWCRLWWKYYGKDRDLCVYVFRRDGDIVGILPLFFDRMKLGPIVIRAGKIVGSDHTMTQFSLSIRRDCIRAVMRRFYELVSRERWDIIYLGPISGLCSHYEQLRSAVSVSFGPSCILNTKSTQVQTYFLLADTWPAQLRCLSRNARKKISRHCRKLKQALHSEPGDLVSKYADPENIDQMFTEFVQMHQAHWETLGKLGHFGDWPDAFDFHREMVKAQLKYDRVRLMVSCWGKRALGYEYAYKFGDRYYAFLNARTDSETLADVNIYTWIFTEQVKKAMSENVRYIDDMRGRYDYKLRLGGELFPIRGIYISNGKYFIRIRVLIFRVLCKLLNLCYYKVWFCRLAPRLPFTRRSLWDVWLRTCSFA